MSSALQNGHTREKTVRTEITENRVDQNATDVLNQTFGLSRRIRQKHGVKQKGIRPDIVIRFRDTGRMIVIDSKFTDTITKKNAEQLALYKDALSPIDTFIIARKTTTRPSREVRKIFDAYGITLVRTIERLKLFLRDRHGIEFKSLEGDDEKGDDKSTEEEGNDIDDGFELIKKPPDCPTAPFCMASVVRTGRRRSFPASRTDRIDQIEACVKSLSCDVNAILENLAGLSKKIDLMHLLNN